MQYFFKPSEIIKVNIIHVLHMAIIVSGYAIKILNLLIVSNCIKVAKIIDISKVASIGKRVRHKSLIWAIFFFSNSDIKTTKGTKTERAKEVGKKIAEICITLREGLIFKEFIDCYRFGYFN